jgi:ElaB/YqjD/DUF883 family membrane-anchored ribosome-binding protein
METFFKNMTAEDGSKERLIHDLRTLVHDAEELIQATGRDVSARSKEQLIGALERFKDTCQRVEKEAVSVARSTDRIIREHPYPSIGIAFGVGVLLGVLITRD